MPCLRQACAVFAPAYDMIAQAPNDQLLLDLGSLSDSIGYPKLRDSIGFDPAPQVLSRRDRSVLSARDPRRLHIKL
jgi:hypothetical protein